MVVPVVIVIAHRRGQDSVWDREPLISCFADGELAPERQDILSDHVAGCPACAAKLAAIRELGDAVRQMPVPAIPADLWNRIADQTPTPPVVGKIRPWRGAVWLRIATVAALVLIAVYTGWLAQRRTAPPDESTVPVVDFGPSLGPQFSLVAGEAQSLSPQEVARRVNFRVLMTPKLPEGYALEESCLVRIKGCNIVQYKYLRGADVALLLQYSQGQPVSFGSRPVAAIVQINSKPVQIVRGEGRLAASWKANGTAVSLIGPRDQAELVRLVAYVDQQLTEGKK